MPAKRRRDDWLEEKIRVSRRGCTLHTCTRCGEEVYMGQSDDDMYWTATTDTTDVDLFAEVVGQLDNRMSYALAKHERGLKLQVRDRYAIRRDARPFVVLDHRCTDKQDVWSSL